MQLACPHLSLTEAEYQLLPGSWEEEWASSFSLMENSGKLSPVCFSGSAKLSRALTTTPQERPPKDESDRRTVQAAFFLLCE